MRRKNRTVRWKSESFLIMVFYLLLAKICKMVMFVVN